MGWAMDVSTASFHLSCTPRPFLSRVCPFVHPPDCTSLFYFDISCKLFAVSFFSLRNAHSSKSSSVILLFVYILSGFCKPCVKLLNFSEITSAVDLF